MAVNTHYSNNLKAVMQVNKNYTDTQIQKSEERILSIVARNNVDFIDHTDEATYRFTAPANAKLLMLQSIAGNSVKYSPSVASDNNATHIKTLPSTVYDLDVSKVEGVGYKVNQLIVESNNDFTISTNSSNYGNFNSTSVENGHKYLIWHQSSWTDTNVVRINAYFGSGSAIVDSTTSGEYKSTIVSISDNSLHFFRVYSSSAQQSVSFHFLGGIFDLTADFGSGNEPSTVSDCYTAYLQRGINIYEYTPQQSSIKNNAFTGVKVEGFNKWDEETEIGAIDTTTGQNYISSNQIRSKNYIKVLPNTNYYCLSPRTLYALFYDINKNVITGYSTGITVVNNASQINNSTFTTPSNCAYMRFYLISAYGTTYNHDICINISGSANGTYVPYIQPTTIPVDLTTIKDSNNNSLFPSGKMMGNSNVADFITPYNQESRWNEVDLGTIDDWEIRSGETNLFQSGALRNLVSKPANNDQVANALCDIYSIDTTNNVLGHTPNTIAIFPSGYIGIYDTSCSTIQELLTKLNGKKFQYERATYLTSNTDLTSLTKINAQSNGTITLNNTHNVDMPNLISYNGVIKHALATAVKQDGFNAWNEEWEVGSIGNDGQNIAGNNTIRSKNYIDVIPNTTYYQQFTIDIKNNLFYYDANNNFISMEQIRFKNTFTTPNNAKYLRFRVDSSYGNTYNNDICINISNQDLNGTYKPHKATITRLLPNSEAKYSWGITTGVRNVRTYCDDEGNAVGEGSLVVGNKDLGLLTYVKAGQGKGFYTTGLTSVIKAPASNSDVANTLSKYNAVSRNDIYNDVEGLAVSVGTGNVTIYTAPLEDLSTTQFATANSGVMLQFEKGNTDTETLDDFDYFFDCEEGDTFTLVNTEQLQCYATYSFLIKEAKSNE